MGSIGKSIHGHGLVVISHCTRDRPTKESVNLDKTTNKFQVSPFKTCYDDWRDREWQAIVVTLTVQSLNATITVIISAVSLSS
jgi:hypothetical protein